MLEAINVHKIYNNGGKELRVLKGIDLKIDRGEFISIFGPSGAGKSTLLHILGGLDEPSEGSVMLDSEELCRLRDRKRAGLRNKKIGFVFQFYHLLPEFSALENVMMPAMIGAKGRCRGKACLAPTKRAEQLLEMVGLKDRMGHKPGQLSGGEQQRVAIARAIVNEPRFLLCDEPTGNLDSESGREVIDLLDRLNKEAGTAVVVATHEAAIAKKAKRALYLKDGKFQ